MAGNLPIVSGRTVARALAAAGFEPRRQRGSHILLRRTEHPRLTVSVPDHKVVQLGTLRAIIRQAGLTVDEFKTLLEK